LTLLPFDSGSAYAQTKKKKDTPPKQKGKDQNVRTAFTAEEQAAAVIPDIPDARVWGDTDADFRKILPTAEGPWLALSGGGADGAFGAGLLIGWSQSGKRPDFAMVTGASIGALIGPYAFLGPKLDDQLKDNFTSITAADVFEDRATPESLFDSWPLKRLIEKRVTPEMLAAIAAEHRKGRRFVVATTNIDAGRRVLWNMGAIAARGDDKSLKLFRDVLLASSSIPGFFQPVAIEVEANGKKFQELHLDGTITSPFFVAPEATLAAADARLPTNQIYVIVNSKVSSDFSMADRKVNSILGRTIGVALVTGIKAELLLMRATAQRLGVNMNIAHVPEGFSEVNRGLFDHIYMEALFKYGAEQAMKGAAFETVAKASVEPTGSTPQ
jgi:predicted acylesterase/phospholipase RssA